MIVALSMFRDEQDVAAPAVEHLLEQGVDKIVVIDNGSTDATPDILAQFLVLVESDPDPRFYQGSKMTALMHRHCIDGDWVIPFDADERWIGLHGTLAETLNSASSDVIMAEVYDYLPQPDDDPAEPDPFRRIRWRETTPEVLPVMAFRYHPDAVIHDGNHGVDHPGSRGAGLRVGHFQYRSFEQFQRKVRRGRVALELTTLPLSTGWHWRHLGALSDDDLHDAWDALVATPGLVLDPCP